MDPVELIQHANAVGLDLRIVDGALRIRGPRRLSGLVELISASKEEVIAALTSVGPPPSAARDFPTSPSADTDTRPEIAGESERVSAAVGPNQPVGEQHPPDEQRQSSEGQGSQNLPNEPVQSFRGAGRLCGSGSPPRKSPFPPPEIRADPVVLCPRCSSRRVLKELREMTTGLCYGCWEGQS